MKPTLAVNRAILKVKGFKDNTKTIADVLDSTTDAFGVINKTRGTDYHKCVDTAPLPDFFQFHGKINGKVYTGLSIIDKKNIMYAKANDATDYVAEKWEYTPKCKCENGKAAKSYRLEVNLDSDIIESQSFRSWGHKDFFYAVDMSDCTPNDGSCEQLGVWRNHVLVLRIFKKYLERKNQLWYKMSINDGTTTYGDNDLATLETYIQTNKAVNTDANTTNNTPYLKIILEGDVTSAIYRDIETKYFYPRGLSFKPFMFVDEGEGQMFTKVRSQKYGEGIGSDMRMLENQMMSLHTNLNYNKVLSDHMPDPNLVYQFENGKLYNTITIEYKVPKSLPTEYNTQIVILGIESTDTTTYTKLKTLFGI